MKDAPRLVKNPKSECPDVRIRLPRHKWHKSWGNIEDLVVLLERNLYGHPLAGLLREGQIEDALSETWMGENSELGMHVRFIANKGYFCQHMCMTSKWLESKQHMAPMWKKLMKHVDIDGPTSFLDYVHLGCTQRECKPNETIFEQHTKMFESRISAGATEKLPGWGPDHVWPDVWTKIGKAAQNREKQEWAKEKPKLDNARRQRGNLLH